jgi:peroxiredoxin
MKKVLKIILPIMLISVLLIAGCSNDADSSDDAASSDDTVTLAPDFELDTLDGQTVRLSDLRGSVVLLNFWRISCGWCVVEMPYLEQVYAEWQEAGLVLFTVNIGDSAEAVAAFLEENDLSLPVLLDTTQAVAIQYSISSIPMTFLIDQDGVIQAVKIGAFQSVEEIEGGLSLLLTK